MGFCVLPGQIFSHPDSSPSWTPIMQIVVHLILSQRSLKLSFFLIILFSFCSATELSITLSSSSLTHSSESFSLLLIPSRVFFYFSYRILHFLFGCSFKSHLFMYQLCWVFVAVQAFSIWGEWGYSLLRCADFSSWWLLLLQSTSSKLQAQ